jgi:hypothetical protein
MHGQQKIKLTLVNTTAKSKALHLNALTSGTPVYYCYSSTYNVTARHRSDKSYK